MPKYSNEDFEENDGKIAKARASSLRVHFKNMREVGHAIKGMNLLKAQKYLEAVLQRKQAVPFKRFTGGRGRHAQAKNLNAPGSQVGWPVKAVNHFVSLLTNVAANAELKNLDLEACKIVHVQVNRAVKQRRRTYRAHGRIGPYMSNPSHVEIIVEEEGEQVAKEDDSKPGKVSRKKIAMSRLRSGRKKVQVGGGN